MISNCYNLTEDWGWYIDIENMRPINQINNDFVKNKNKNLHQKINNIYTIIEEDEYDYYMNNHKNFEEKIYNESNLKNPVINPNNHIISFGSTTLITVFITYVVFVIL